MSTLNLADYRLIVADLPRPSNEQIANFAYFVSGAHSWYKHLPFGQPGTPFYFFIDPCAGCDQVISRDGAVDFVPRTEQGFHYSSIPTADYLEQFGYMAFFCGSRTKVYSLDDEGDLTGLKDEAPFVVDTQGWLRMVSKEVMRAGQCCLTSVIHPHAALCDHWGDFPDWVVERPTWPEESGGEDTLNSIYDRCRVLRSLRASSVRPDEIMLSPPPYSTTFFVDPLLWELMTPERERQLNQMIVAMRQMRDLVFD